MQEQLDIWGNWVKIDRFGKVSPAIKYSILILLPKDTLLDSFTTDTWKDLEQYTAKCLQEAEDKYKCKALKVVIQRGDEVIKTYRYLGKLRKLNK